MATCGWADGVLLLSWCLAPWYLTPLGMGPGLSMRARISPMGRVLYSYRNETDAEYQFDFDKDFLKATPEFSRPTSRAEDVVQCTLRTLFSTVGTRRANAELSPSAYSSCFRSNLSLR
ncbi:hypothetical protein PLEOSDRAFT_170169 [Pleurotus ostreatus PC15]|uniref:Uncharacterized protein n=1 Tax=Pleurotus ostreatus (strain PC15) TaxID=1137138 RepID=A0A067NA49_PLEO1|nr:hypothetical protein PLEOSDRAFT_170169 [Pleurotus ostreatus PC15]